VLPPTVSARVAVEAGIAQSWHKLVGDSGQIVSIERYGESADYKTIFREFGFTPEAVVAAAERALNSRMSTGRTLELLQKKVCR
jgi:transketolase